MLKYSENVDHLTQAAVIKLYNSVGWSIYTRDPQTLMAAISESSYVITCHEDNRLIGLVRSLSDNLAIHYIQDILVDPDFQRQGVGRELLTRCLDRYRHVRSHVLLTDDEERQRLFYQSLGFCNTREVAGGKLNCFVRMTG